MRTKHPRTATATLLTSALIAAAACAPGAADTAAVAATIRDSAGVTIVENPAVGDDQLPFWTIDSVPAFTIGMLDGDPAYEFTSIKEVTRLPNGMIVVIDGRGESAYEFRFYDSTGRHVATHGRPGMGPGEFRWVSFVGTAGGDTVIAVDFPARRISWLSASQGYLRSTMVDEQRYKDIIAQDVAWVAEAMTPLGDSIFAIRPFRTREGGGVFSRYAHFAIVNFTTNSAIHLADYDESGATARLQLSRGPSNFMTEVDPGLPVDAVDRARGRMCGVYTRVVEITCITTAGERTIIRWQPDSIEYTADDRKRVEDALRRNLSNSRYYGPGDADKIIAAYVWPTYHTPVNTIQMDDDGNIWVLEKHRGDDGNIGMRFRVLNPRGEQIAFATGVALSPHRHINISHIGSTHLLRKIADADGVDQIGVFPIHR